MFFLVYVPTIRQPLSDEEINRLSEHFADQLLAQSVAAEDSDLESSDIKQIRSAIKEQVLGLITSMHQKFVGGANMETVGEPDALSVVDSEETAQIKDFLERCFKDSA